MDGLKVRKVQLIIDQIDSLPTLPAVAARVLSLASSDDASARDLTQIIESDPALTSRILALVNSATFGRAKSVAAVNRAVTLLGFEAVRSSVLSLKVFDLFSRRGAEAAKSAFDRVSFWKHSLAVAAAAQLIARRVRGVSPEEVFVAGLLHDLGKVALDYALPKTFDQVIRSVQNRRISFMDAENRILGLDHAVIGKRLAQNWQFPETLVNVIWLHHQSPAHLPENLAGTRMVQIVHLADLLARRQRIGLTSPILDAAAVTTAAEGLGLPLEQVEAVEKGLHAVVAEQVQIMGLEQTGEKDLFYESLQSANGELGVINQRLMATSARLEQEKRHGEILIRLSSGVGAATTLPVLLSATADAVMQWAESPRAAVYVVDQERSYVEGIVKDHDGSTLEHFVFDSAQSDITPMLADLSVAAGNELGRAEAREGWLFERVGRLLGQGPFYSLTLSLGGERLGAVVFSDAGRNPESPAADAQKLAAIAATAALAISRLRERERLVTQAESLADANRRAAEAQAEALRRRNLASVGSMAAGAAHEINNPLAVISGRAQILAENEHDEGRRKGLQIIVDQAERASGIISELMAFARPPVPVFVTADPCAIVRKAVESRAAAVAEAGIELVTEISPDVPAATLDSRQVQWAIEELIANAASATERGGRITVRADYQPSGRQLVLSVTDTGSGMDDNTLARACDPFFSGRRAAGRGRGMGLTKVERVAESNRAELQIESAVGQGTSVRLAFDLDQQPAPSPLVAKAGV